MDADEEAEDALRARSDKIASGGERPDARGCPDDGRGAFEQAGYGQAARTFRTFLVGFVRAQ